MSTVQYLSPRKDRIKQKYSPVFNTRFLFCIFSLSFWVVGASMARSFCVSFSDWVTPRGRRSNDSTRSIAAPAPAASGWTSYHPSRRSWGGDATARFLRFGVRVCFRRALISWAVATPPKAGYHVDNLSFFVLPEMPPKAGLCQDVCFVAGSWAC